MSITRRRFGTIASSALALLVVGNACTVDSGAADRNDGRLTARPRAGVATVAVKEQTLGLERGRDAVVHLPPNATGALPLFVMLHGAGGSGEAVLRRVALAADEAGVAVLAPDSRGSTWDAIRGGFGPDVTYLNRALGRVFESVAIDPARIAVGGFSDGATYALSLGRINGDLFQRVAAFSPGFVIDGAAHGKAQFFISHGTSDPILPIDQTSLVIVPALRKHGYDVTFREFDGRHEIPSAVAVEAMRWLTAPTGALR